MGRPENVARTTFENMTAVHLEDSDSADQTARDICTFVLGRMIEHKRALDRHEAERVVVLRTIPMIGREYMRA